ncbi:MAG: class I glutamine amidotransferase [Candidatus Scalindua rubra]|uniref:Class I glutamine amidotransferase n=1 Tax=Candidatus Scalindua rubra TaxID=1872076 RepID=A0A1E3XFE2_9BACT|nr:MAG: class I glutamine amidotransferase [Candidatus Scalindua rubra]
MKYLGIARKEKGQVIMPDAFQKVPEGKQYEAIELGNDIILVPSPVDRERLARIERLANISIEEHRKTLKGLAK